MTVLNFIAPYSTPRTVRFPNELVPLFVPRVSFVLLAGPVFFLCNRAVILARLRSKSSDRKAGAGKDVE